MRRDGQRAIGAVLLLGALFGVAMWWVQRGSDEEGAHGPMRRGDANPSPPLVSAAGADAAERSRETLDPAGDGKPAPSSDENASAGSPAAAPRDFHVHVFDEADGRPVAHASVFVSRFRLDSLSNTTMEWGPEPALQTHSGSEPMSQSAIATAKSDGAGDAVVAVAPTSAPESTNYLDVLAMGYAPVWCTAAPGRGTRERPLEIGLAKTASLRGTVLGPDRQPAAGMTLLLQFDRRALERPRRPFGSMLTGAHGRCEAVTNAAGTFEFVALPADVELSLSAGADENEMRKWRTHLWLDPGVQRELTWNLPRGASVSGRVVAMDGTPIAEAIVLVVSFVQGIQAETRSDASGNFRVDAAPSGSVALQIDPCDAHRAVQVVPLELADGEERSGVEVRILDAAPLVVRALDPDGTPVFPAEMRVFPAALRLLGHNFVLEARPDVDADSASSIPAVPFGNVVVRVVAPLTSTWPAVETGFHHDGAHECEVHFTAGARLSGRLVDALDPDQSVVAAVTLLRRDVSRPFWNAQVMQSMAGPGTFDFSNLAAGIYDVLAQADDGRVGVVSKIWLGAGEQRKEVVVPLALGATLELLVPPSVSPSRAYFEQGSSIRFEARQSGDFVGAAFATPLGRVHLTVPPGRVTIEAIAGGEILGTKEVVAKLGKVVRARF